MCSKAVPSRLTPGFQLWLPELCTQCRNLSMEVLLYWYPTYCGWTKLGRRWQWILKKHLLFNNKMCSAPTPLPLKPLLQNVSANSQPSGRAFSKNMGLASAIISFLSAHQPFSPEVQVQDSRNRFCTSVYWLLQVGSLQMFTLLYKFQDVSFTTIPWLSVLFLTNDTNLL